MDNSNFELQQMKCMSLFVKILFFFFFLIIIWISLIKMREFVLIQKNKSGKQAQAKKKLKTGESLKADDLSKEIMGSRYSCFNHKLIRCLNFLRCFLAKMTFLICLSISLKVTCGGVDVPLWSLWFLSRQIL